MFTRCLFCHSLLPANETVEHFPHGQRIAYDPGRGRLWAICDACRRWNLAPIEERWEALEELDKLVHDKGRTVSKTDNIALIRAADIQIVRVGRATQLVEEAWWRYSRELRERRSRHNKLNWLEMGALLAVSLSAGGMWWMFQGDGLNRLVRWHKYGSMAWQGRKTCPRCGWPLEEIRFKETGKLIVVASEESSALDDGEGLAVEMICPRCPTAATDARYRIDGVAAQHLLRRTLAWHHFSGASEKRVREATQAIETVGSAERFARLLGERQMRIDKLEHKKNRTATIALEIALNDETERRLLELELAELEDRWREEERLAAIVDDELTPVPALERLRRLLNPGARPS